MPHCVTPSNPPGSAAKINVLYHSKILAISNTVKRIFDLKKGVPEPPFQPDFD